MLFSQVAGWLRKAPRTAAPHKALSPGLARVGPIRVKGLGFRGLGLGV